MDVLPQAALVDDRILVVAGVPDQSLANDVLAAFSAGDAIKVHQEINRRSEHTPARLVIDRKSKRHLVRASSNEVAARLRSVLRKGVSGSTFSEWDPPRELRMIISVDVNVPGRCACKMTFNMATKILGADRMLDRCFDPVRSYILGHHVLSGSAQAANGEEGARIDYRFVDPWMTERQCAANVGYASDHSILLGTVGGELCGSVVLFGGREVFNVRLGSTDPRSSDRLPIGLWCHKATDWWVPLGCPIRAWRYDEADRWRAPPS